MSSQETYRRAYPHLELPYVSWGLPYEVACAKHIKETYNASRIYIVASGSLSRNGNFFQRLKDAIGEENIVGIQIGVTPHNPFSEVLNLLAEFKKTKTDCIVTFGGGSIIDACKGAVLAEANDVDTFDGLDELFEESLSSYRATGVSSKRGSTLPMICITTTLSGGEFNGAGGCTNDITKHKRLFWDAGRGPKLIIMDPELTVTTPEKIWLSTGVRALDHCVESICSSDPDPAVDEAAEKGLELLIPGLLACKKDPKDLKARLNCQIGLISSMIGLNNPKNVPVGASHGIGHQLGPYGVSHGVTSCITMPAVAKWNAKKNLSQQERVLDIFWRSELTSGILRNAGLVKGKADLGDCLNVVIMELGMPRSLKEEGVSRDQLDKIADSSLGDFFCQTNCIPLTERSQVLEILDACYEKMPVNKA